MKKRGLDHIKVGSIMIIVTVLAGVSYLTVTAILQF